MNERQAIIDRILNGGTMSAIESKTHPDIAKIESEFIKLQSLEQLSSCSKTSFSLEEKKELDGLRTQLKSILLRESQEKSSSQIRQNRINTRQSIVERILNSGTMSEIEAKDHPDIHEIEAEFSPLLQIQSIRSLIKLSLSSEEKKQLENLRTRLKSLALKK